MHKFKTAFRAAASCAAAAAMFAALCGTAEAASKVVTFDIPDAGTQPAQGTIPSGINGKNVVTGFYIDSSNITHGFIGQASTTLTTFDAPGAGTQSYDGTWPVAINGSGVVAGYYIDSVDTHGFVREKDGTFEQFDDVLGKHTYPRAINDAGTVVGTGSYGAEVFIRGKGGKMTTFTIPNGSATPIAINADGTIAGYFYDGTGHSEGFVRTTDGNVTLFNIPGFSYVYVSGMDDAGNIAGYAYTDYNSSTGFFRSADGTVTTISPGNCTRTQVTAMNDSDIITGYCAGADLVFQGFTRLPDGTTTMYAAPGAGTSQYSGTFPQAIGPTGKAVGYAQDNSDVEHGYRINPPKQN
jgi:hypothetical protein